RAAGKHGAEQVDLDGLFPIVPVDRLQSALRAVHPSATDQRVDSAELLTGESHECIHGFGLGDVGARRDHTRVGPQALNLAMRVFQGLGVSTADDHVRPFLDKLARDGKPNSLAAAGDDGATALQPHGAVPTPGSRTRLMAFVLEARALAASR